MFKTRIASRTTLSWPSLLLPMLVASSPLMAADKTTASPANAAGDALTSYAAALDRLLQNDADGAGVLLSRGIVQNGATAELNLLLALLQMKAGHLEAAWETADAVSARSPLAATLATRLEKLSAPAARRAALAQTYIRLAQSDARLARLEAEMLRLVNEARRAQGLSTLQGNETLAAVARAHSAEMRDKDYFAHESPDPQLRDLMDRYNVTFDRPPRLIAENIFRSWGGRHELSEADATRAHESLMNSPGHRANILLAGISQIGIGIVSNEKGDLWVTQMFLKP